jgi:hypothetical protein
MSHWIQKTILSGLCMAAAGAAMADVTVNFIDSDHFSDLAPLTAPRELVLKEFTQHFQKLSATLPPDKDLVIDVLDIDLAGYSLPGEFNRGDPRVFRHSSTYAPHVVLRYTLSEHGKVVSSNTVDLTDPNERPGLHVYPGGLRYPREMSLIDTWWRRTVQPQQLAQR